MAGVASAQEANDANIGDGLYMERPAPSPDPGTELRSEPSAAPAPPAAPAPAPASTPAPASVAVASPAASTPAVAASASGTPARATEVRGIQIERPAAPASPDASATLAVTGVDNTPLVVLAGALIAVGALLIRSARPRPAVL